MKYMIIIFLISISTMCCNHFDTEDLDTQFVYFKSTSFKNSNITTFKKGGVPDIHVSVDGVTLGKMRVPQKMAFNTENNEAGLIIFPAVPLDGRISNSTVYPLLKFVEAFVPKNPLHTDTMNVVFDYIDETEVNLVEGFEFGNLISLDIDDNVNTVITRTDETAYEGEYCGKIHLTKEEPEIHVAAINKLVVPQIHKGIFLELTYKNDVELFVGLSAKNNSGNPINKYKIYLAPRDHWNTVYIDLTKDYKESGSSDVRLAFGAELDTAEKNTGDIYIDNIKLLYY